MPDIYTFSSTTPRFALPNLFAAQSQKEFTVNEALALIDAMLQPAVEGETNDPPANPENGECWLIGDAPTGDWSARPGQIACHQGGNWLFVLPVEGMTVFDKSLAQTVRHDGGWVRPSLIQAPQGGGTIDAEARAAISEIVMALQTSGILPKS